ncbi:MAG: hypothetical protein EOO07_11815 [Chitinophagaceae bacterium]|nr:MAG: hypothetical protein EOO07_11815 [Chitinophagaceae bacterium]
MKKFLLLLLATLPFLANAQGPGGVGLPAIWLKANAGVTPNTPDNTSITGWTNQGSIPFTLIPSGVSGSPIAPTFRTGDNPSVEFGANSAMVYNQLTNELSSVLGDGSPNKKYEVFIVGSSNELASPYITLSGATPNYATTGGGTGGTSPLISHIGFGPRAIFYNNNATGTANGDGETGFYGGAPTRDPSRAYTPNVLFNTNPKEIAIAHISSSPITSYTDLGSLIFSVNGYANFKQADGIAATITGRAHQGVERDVSSNNTAVYNLNVEKIFLGGKLNFDGSGLISTGTTRRKQGRYYEIIVYPRALTVEERQKVYSYLAVKYNTYLAHDQNTYSGSGTTGVSAGNGETVNNGTYFASDGSIILKRDGYTFSNDQDYLGNAAVGFLKDVYYPLSATNTNSNFQMFGRDDASGLNTWLGGNLSGVYFEKTPKSQMPGDKQFMTMTSNVATLASYSTTNDATTPFPAGSNIEGRLARTWRITTTGYNGAFNINPYVTPAFIASNGFTDANTVLLVSKDPTFAADKTAAISGFTGVSSGFLSKTPLVSDILGAVTSGEYKAFYVTFAKTNGSATGLPTTLPVNLTSFTAKANNSSVSLAWTTASETNAAHYNVTRSIDANNFSVIGKIAAAGNSTTLKTYNFTDFSPAKGTNYYQLQQVDLDGTENPSGVVSAKIAAQSTELTVTATAANSVTVNIYVSKATTGSLTASNVTGQKLSTQAVKLAEGNNSITVQTASAKGLIILSLNSAEGTLSKKIIK